ncbi:MAG: RsmB/NOP family class I SAM-dependent RNA methyltransferase [Candidatus Thermoplasmatota archaeon]|nr:RsmB/NOP family class I SAM-dependent RNA methyltransferase [Candidatus Thermoplasmatota archaeon]
MTTPSILKKYQDETPLELLTHEFIRDVLAGKKSNTAMHYLLKRGRPGDRSLLVQTCHGTLRYWFLIRAAIGVDDPLQMAASGVLLFTDGLPTALRIDRARMSVLKERMAALKKMKKWKDMIDVPETIALDSVPAWLGERLKRSLGEGARWILADALLPPRYLCIRTNTILTSREDLIRELEQEGVRPVRSELDPDALLVPDGTPIDKLVPYREGRMEVQDISSQISCYLALTGIEQGRVIDACAGNGGKSLALSALMQNRGTLISMDTNERSLMRLRQRGRRASVWNYQRVHIDDERKLDPYLEWADVVLVDAPCSGLGTMRRNPDIRLHLTEEKMRELPDIQSDLLRGYSRLVRRGGRLVYSTCSVDPAENEEVVNGFLERNEDFRLTPARDLGPHLPEELFRGLFFHPMPGEDRSGFFEAVMERDRSSMDPEMDRRPKRMEIE